MAFQRWLGALPSPFCNIEKGISTPLRVVKILNRKLNLSIRLRRGASGEYILANLEFFVFRS